jgi:DNA-binding NtrC family response regulator
MLVRNAAMADVLTMAERAAAGEGKVLITGESGAGKDVIARHIHDHSRRRTQPFVAVNFSGTPESAIESQLFGRGKGGLSGAFRDRLGALQFANRGTLLLDEIGEMSLRMQALLLRFLEGGEGGGLGSTARINARVISATNRNLPEMIAAGAFREDLFYKLRVIQLHVPPLRDRPEDIRSLAQTFLSRARVSAAFSDDALTALVRYRWPGNVRELQSVVEQAAWLTPSDRIDLAQLPAGIRAAHQSILSVSERRTLVADELYKALVVHNYSFWNHVYPLFLARDITRHDIRGLVRRGLATTRGNYRMLLQLFGMAPDDYKRFLNFLAAHDCRADFREFRSVCSDAPPSTRPELRAAPGRRAPREDAEAGENEAVVD